MKPGIMLLLCGGEADLSTTICAVQFAARSDGKLYAVRHCLPAADGEAAGGSYTDGFGFVVEFAGSEGVRASCHLMEDNSIAEMAAFLRAHSITCMVVGKDDDEHGPQSGWLAEVRQEMRRDSQAEPRIIVAPLLEEMDMRQVVRQFRRRDKK